MLDYSHRGERWTVPLKAESWADAKQRLDAIATTGKISGELVFQFPCASPAWLTRNEQRLWPLGAGAIALLIMAAVEWFL